MNSPPTPPNFLLRFFRWFCHPELHPFIEGDLLELYEERVEDLGRRKASIRFAWDVVLLFRPGIIRSFKLYQPSNHRAMLRHNLLLTFRSFQRYKSTFLINLIGLSSGLACALLIFLWVQDELSVDKFHANDNQFYQVLHNIPTSEGIVTTETTQGLLAEALTQEMQIGRAHVWTPVTDVSRMPSSAWKKKKKKNKKQKKKNKKKKKLIEF